MLRLGAHSQNLPSQYGHMSNFAKSRFARDGFSVACPPWNGEISGCNSSLINSRLHLEQYFEHPGSRIGRNVSAHLAALYIS